MIKYLCVCGVAAACLSIGLSPARATPALQVTDINIGYFNGADASAGWSFTTNMAITVIALDAWKVTGSDAVRLYDASGTILASAMLSTANAHEGSPTAFYTQSITPVTLAANTTYYIAEDMTNDVTEFIYRAGGVTTDHSITYGAEVASIGMGGTPTGDYFSGAYDPSFFGPNFDIPEPASMTLFGAGLAGLRWARRRRTVRLGTARLPG